MTDVSKKSKDASLLKRAYLALEASERKRKALQQRQCAPIAIVGIGCRFPGGINSPQTLWEQLLAGVNAVGEAPRDRWLDEAAAVDSADVPMFGAFLDQIDQFDPQFFGIAPREAAGMDPQHRLLLEVAWEAMEDAAIPMHSLEGSATGAFVGICSNDYWELQATRNNPDEIDAHYASGIAHSIGAGRLSYTFGFQGPCLSIDTACSSSLVAIHQACLSLRSGECEQAIAGGVNVITSPKSYLAFGRTGMLSPNGRCATFDAAADGFVRGEGCGLVVLKPLAAARRDGDQVYAVIRGSAINQDGSSSGITVPNGPAQQALIGQALENAGLKPEDVDYVEGHGTGTELGDPLEVQALAAAYGSRPKDRPLGLGSLKTNFGHMEAAAGVAGLIKLALSLKYQQIPAHQHFHTPSPKIRWQDYPVEVINETRPWPQRGDQDGDQGGNLCGAGGVSSFGFSGTNAHLILSAAPPEPPPGVSESSAPSMLTPPLVLPLTAVSPAALKALAERWATYLEAAPETAYAQACAAAALGRTPLDVRCSVFGNNPAELLAALQHVGIHDGHGAAPEDAQIALLFGAAGGYDRSQIKQWRDQIPEFDQHLKICGQWLAANADLSLDAALDQTEAEPGENPLPGAALVALQTGLAAQMMKFGAQPAAVVGLGVGEYSALAVAGAVSLEAALALASTRDQQLALLQDAGAAGWLAAGDHQCRALTADIPGVHPVLSAGDNHTVLAGTTVGVDAALAAAVEQDLAGGRLTAAPALFSPLMAALQTPLNTCAESFQWHPPRMPLVLASAGGQVNLQALSEAGYWGSQPSRPVPFAGAARALSELAPDVLLEVGPQAQLAGLYSLEAGEPCPRVICTSQPGESAQQTTGRLLAQLFDAGVAVNWAYVMDVRARGGHGLPSYPFQRRRYWLSPPAAQPRPASVDSAGPALDHPLLEAALSIASDDIIYPVNLGGAPARSLKDHAVMGTPIMPATGFMDLVLSAARDSGLDAGGRHCLVLSDLTFADALLLDPLPAQIQLVLSPEAGTDPRWRFRVMSCAGPGADWRPHVTGQVAAGSDVADPPPPLSELRKTLNATLDTAEFYARLSRLGLAFGPAFKVLGSLSGKADHGGYSGAREAGPKTALGDLEIPDGLYSAQFWPPAHLDGCLQVMAAAASDVSGVCLPMGIDQITFHQAPAQGRVFSHATLAPGPGPGGSITAALNVYNAAGDVLVSCRGLHLAQVSEQELRQQFRRQALAATQAATQATTQAATQGINTNQLFELAWQPGAGAPGSIADQVTDQYAQLKRLAEQHQVAHADRFTASLNTLCSAYVAAALKRLGWDLRVSCSLAELQERCGIAPRHERLLRRLLTLLADDQIITFDADSLSPGPRQYHDINLERLQQQLGQVAPEHPEIAFVLRCGPHLDEVLTDRADPVSLLFDQGGAELSRQLYAESPLARSYNTLLQQTLEQLQRETLRRPLKILEVGGGSGATTSYVMPHLADQVQQYVFTDLGPAFVQAAQNRFGAFGAMQFRPLDISADPISQGLEPASFDVVIATNVLHATADLARTLGHVHELLAPGGVLLALEVTTDNPWVDLTFGLTEGWWLYTDTHLRRSGPLLDQRGWLKLLADVGFETVNATPEAPQPLLSNALLMAQRQRAALAAQPFVLVGHSNDLMRALATRLEQLTVSVTCVGPGVSSGPHAVVKDLQDKDALASVWQRMGIADARPAVIYVASQSSADDGAPQLDGTRETVALIGSLLAAGCSNLSTLTLLSHSGQQATPDDVLIEPDAAMAAGLVASANLEQPGLRARSVDLAAAPVSALELQTLADLLLADPAETHVAVRGRQWLARRLKPYDPPPALPPSYQLTGAGSGELDQIAWRGEARQTPGPGQVEIEVRASGLNFRDVLNVLGTYVDGKVPLGGECAGVVAATGPDVTHVQPGDPVLAVGHHSLASHSMAPAGLTVAKPGSWTDAQAAGFPIAFLTAEYSLKNLGRLKAGESVLIHAGAGGVGMAAVQICLELGARVYATAGSPVKRQRLLDLGVTEAFDSRSLSFSQQLRRSTDGRGVDLVLNSLAGDFIPASVEVTAQHGRFVELGRTDIWSPERMEQERPDVAYHAVNLTDQMAHQDPELCQALANLVGRTEAGSLSLLPTTVFDHAEVSQAFRFMAQGKHLGKLVVAQPRPAVIRDNASYLVTGAFAGLGLLVCRWLADQGAGQIIMLGRREPDAHTLAVIAELAAGGSLITRQVGDVSHRSTVQRALDAAGDQPLAGIIHCAGALNDGLLGQQSLADFEQALKAKVYGSWHLHELSQAGVNGHQLDLFVLFSSIAAVVGSAGQANHAAANSFMDALAQRRRRQGLCGISINWGAWSGVGAAVRNDVLAQAARTGLGGLSPATGMHLFEQLLSANPEQVAALEVDWQQFVSGSAGGVVPPLLRDLIKSAPASGESRQQVAEADEGALLPELLAGQDQPGQRKTLLTYVREQAAVVLGLDGAEAVSPQVALNDIGLDSLLAVELRNVLARSAGVSLPATLLFDYPTCEQLTDYLLTQLDAAVDVAPASESAPASASDMDQSNPLAALDALEEMSDEEVARLLAGDDEQGPADV